MKPIYRQNLLQGNHTDNNSKNIIQTEEMITIPKETLHNKNLFIEESLRSMPQDINDDIQDKKNYYY